MGRFEYQKYDHAVMMTPKLVDFVDSQPQDVVKSWKYWDSRPYSYWTRKWREPGTVIIGTQSLFTLIMQLGVGVYLKGDFNRGDTEENLQYSQIPKS